MDSPLGTAEIVETGRQHLRVRVSLVWVCVCGPMTYIFAWLLNGLWCSPQRWVCGRNVQLNSSSQVPPQFIFQSKSGSFYSEQLYHKCTFLSSQRLLQWRTRLWVLFRTRSYHSSPSSAGQDKTWRNLHMKEENQHNASATFMWIIWLFSLCTSLNFLSIIPYLGKGSSFICISQRITRPLLGSFIGHTAKDFLPAPPTLHS